MFNQPLSFAPAGRCARSSARTSYFSHGEDDGCPEAWEAARPHTGLAHDQRFTGARPVPRRLRPSLRRYLRERAAGRRVDPGHARVIPRRRQGLREMAPGTKGAPWLAASKRPAVLNSSPSRSLRVLLAFPAVRSIAFASDGRLLFRVNMNLAADLASTAPVRGSGAAKSKYGWIRGRSFEVAQSVWPFATNELQFTRCGEIRVNCWRKLRGVLLECSQIS